MNVPDEHGAMFKTSRIPKTRAVVPH